MRANQDCDRKTKTESKIDNLFPSLAESPHECLAIGAQHVNRRDDHSPKRKHRRDLEDVKMIQLPPVLERAKKDHDFPGKIRETRQTDRSEYAKTKSEAGKGHHFGKAAQFIKNQRAGALPQFSSEPEEQRNRKAMSEYQDNSTDSGEDRSAGDPQENITHVHHA